MREERAPKFNILPLYSVTAFFKHKPLLDSSWEKNAKTPLIFSHLDKRITFVNYIMNWTRGCGLRRAADAAERYKKWRLCPWTTPNAPKLHSSL